MKKWQGKLEWLASHVLPTNSPANFNPEGRKEEQGALYLWGRGCHSPGMEHSDRSCSPAGTQPEPGADSPWFWWNQPRQRESPAHTVALPKGRGETPLIPKLKMLWASQGSAVAQLEGEMGDVWLESPLSHWCLLKPCEQQEQSVRNTPRDAPLGSQHQSTWKCVNKIQQAMCWIKNRLSCTGVFIKSFLVHFSGTDIYRSDLLKLTFSEWSLTLILKMSPKNHPQKSPPTARGTSHRDSQQHFHAHHSCISRLVSILMEHREGFHCLPFWRIWSPSADGAGESRQWTYRGWGDFGSLINFPPENKGKVKWAVNSAHHCQWDDNSMCHQRIHPKFPSSLQGTLRKQERSPSCYQRLKPQELKNVPIKKNLKKKLISCCCTSTLHQLSVIHTLLFEFRPYKWGNTLRVTCQVPPADDLWTDLL